eukprot:scaffold6968_cov117-Isochrysis_galbana.AAC.1
MMLPAAQDSEFTMPLRCTGVLPANRMRWWTSAMFTTGTTDEPGLATVRFIARVEAVANSPGAGRKCRPSEGLIVALSGAGSDAGVSSC